MSPEDCIYDINGVLVHSGAQLEAGHYYSLIRDRETGFWWKFNDHKVEPFDLQYLEAETFGGAYGYDVS